LISCGNCHKDLNFHNEVQSEKCLKELSIYHGAVNTYLTHLRILMNPSEHKRSGVRLYEDLK